MALKINTCSLILISFSTKSFVFSFKPIPFSKENLLTIITKYWGGWRRMVLSVCFVSLVHTQQFLVKSTLSDSLINLDVVKLIFGLILNSLILDTDYKPDSDLHIEQIYLILEMKEKNRFLK